MRKPRQVKVLSTEHFDILFSKESTFSAKIIAENAENIFNKVISSFETNQKLRIIVVISPDSDELFVEYSPYPYNRIVVYEGVPRDSSIDDTDSLLEKFELEVVKAIFENVKSPFWNGVYNFFNMDYLQPLVLLNMPDTFANGAATQSYNQIFGDKDAYKKNLELLIFAKQNNKFPSWVDVSGAKDFYTQEDLELCATSAFSAYIMQRWGWNKFLEYWNECGKIHFFKLMPQIFEKVYKITLEQAWEEFKQSIPQVSVQNQSEVNDNSKNLFNNLKSSFYKFITNTPYGVVAYDEIKNEVIIFDKNSSSKMRRLLFFATDVKNISLSTDGRFLTICHTQSKERENFREDIARIFDLETRRFLKSKFKMRQANVISLGSNQYAIAGVDVSQKFPMFVVQEISSILEKNDTGAILFKKIYDENTIFAAPFQIDFQTIGMKVQISKKDYFYSINLKTKQEQLFDFGVNFSGLKKLFISSSALQTNFMYAFEYLSQNDISRLGCVIFNKEAKPEQILLQTQDFEGGIHNPFIFRNNFFYSTMDENDFKVFSVPFQNIKLDYGKITECDFLPPEFKKSEIPQMAALASEYELLNYNPFKYMFKGSIVPFLPIMEINLREGVVLNPGLGIAYSTQADPFFNTEILFSAGYSFFEFDFAMLENQFEENLSLLKSSLSEEKRKFTFAYLLKNTSTPIDISAGGLFNFTKNGAYNLKGLAKTSWITQLPMSFRKLKIDLHGMFSFSTSYHDEKQTDLFPKLKNWPSLADCYKLAQAEALVEYTDAHQYGKSSFERVGITAGSNIYSMWDFSSMKDKFSPTQINLGLFGTLEIPYLLPIQSKNNWIFTMPSSIYTELFYTNGTAFKSGLQVLLAGKEIQKSFFGNTFYFSRVGLKGGYDISFVYDIDAKILPDLRDFTRFYDVFEHTSIEHRIYFVFAFDFAPIIGVLSSSNIKNNLEFSFYPQTKKFKVNYSLEVKI